MENNATPDRLIFLQLAALTDATIEFGGLSSYATDRVDIVMYSFRRRIAIAGIKANNNKHGEQLAVSAETVTSGMTDY
ncbi:hypothetical protein [Mucilaginibacter sp. BT774]|uniref:hypothetical protein n=1 Tax=Mucilaginibacter sp. BT774 TaxID=3062276 RepID=UPI00267705E6|nr:hypothetical protein [Mucilaginibacter sp. BT774]MDO3627572.1 hypothetical protein [Mucilaginibacter sp. BT774]